MKKNFATMFVSIVGNYFWYFLIQLGKLIKTIGQSSGKFSDKEVEGNTSCTQENPS